MRMFSIFLNDLRRLGKNFGVIAGLLLMPLALMGPMILNYQGGDDEGLKGTPLIVANYDGGQVSLDFIKELSDSLLIEQNFSGDLLTQYNLQADARCAQPSAVCAEAVGRARLADQSRQAILIIPAGLGAAFDKNEQTPVTLLYDPGSDAIKLTQIEKVAQGLAIKVALTKQIEGAKSQFTDLSAIGSPEVQAEVNKITSQPVSDGNNRAIHVDEVYPVTYTEKKKPNLVETVIPEFAVMFIFLIVMFMTSWAREEQSNGLFRRLFSTPAGKSDLIGGKLLFGVSVCFVQMIILFALGVTFASMRGLGVKLDIPAFLLISLTLAGSATALGLFFSATKLATSAAFAPMFLGAILGGVMIPTDFLPAFLRPLTFIFPQYYGMTGYQDLLVRGGGVAQVLPEAGILLLFTVIFTAAAIWLFDPRD